MWTDERVELLKKLWAEGLSASQVAKQLGGVTRNAVIGKVHRLGLSGRVTPNRPVRVRPEQPRTPAAARPRTQADAQPARIAAQQEDQEPEQAPAEKLVVARESFEPERRELATVLTLTDRTCKWPIGDPGSPDFHFCGKKRDSGAPYCTDHAKIAYQPVQPRRNRERERQQRRDSGFAL